MQGIEIPQEVSFAKQVLKELDEMEARNRDTQYDSVLKAFRQNFKSNGNPTLYYHAILYDEVRQRLEKDGFKVITATQDAQGRVRYEISKKENGHILESERASASI